MAKRAGHKAAKIATQTANRYVCVKTCKLMGGSLLDSLVEDDRVVSAIKAKKIITLKDWEGIMDFHTEEHNDFSDTV